MFWTSIFVKLHKNLSHLPLWKIYWVDFHKHSSYHLKFNFFAKIKLKINSNYIIFLWFIDFEWCGKMRAHEEKCPKLFFSIFTNFTILSCDLLFVENMLKWTFRLPVKGRFPRHKTSHVFSLKIFLRFLPKLNWPEGPIICQNAGRGRLQCISPKK